MALSLAPLSTSKPADGHLLVEEELHELLEACDLVADAHDVGQHQRRPKRHCRTSLGVEQMSLWVRWRCKNGIGKLRTETALQNSPISTRKPAN